MIRWLHWSLEWPMTAILNVTFPLTATWEDDIQMAGKYFYSRHSAKVKNYSKLFLRSEGVQKSKQQQV